MKLNIQMFGIVDYSAAEVNALNAKVTSTRETIESQLSSINNNLTTLSENWYNPRGKAYGDAFQSNLNSFINLFNSYINSFGEAVAAAGNDYAQKMEGEPVGAFSAANVGNISVTFVSEKGGRQGGDDTAGSNFQSATKPNLDQMIEAMNQLTSATNSSTAFDEPTMSTLRGTVSASNAKVNEMANMSVEDFINAGLSLDESSASAQSSAQSSFSGN